MGEKFNDNYNRYNNYFGNFPEDILVKYVNKIPAGSHVLDIGAGQGRHSVYLAEQGCLVDAVDSSETAIEILKKFRHGKINYIQTDISKFDSSPNRYSAILLFGIIQILTREQISSLIDNVKLWIRKGGLIFVTAFGKDDEKYKNCKNNWKEIGNNSFESDDKRVRTFLEENEILKLFNGFEIIYHWEGLGKRHRHGDGPIEQHSMIELVARKPQIIH